MQFLDGELDPNCLCHPVQLLPVAFASHLKSARSAPAALEEHCDLRRTQEATCWGISPSTPLLNSVCPVEVNVLLTPACHLLHHLHHHLWAAVNSKPLAAIIPKLNQLIQPLLRELRDSPDQMAPDLPVADQPKQTRREFATVQQGVRIQVEKDGKDLAIREAFQS